MLADQLRLVNAQILETGSPDQSQCPRHRDRAPADGHPRRRAAARERPRGAVPDPQAFRSGRNLAAWIGLVPRQNSSGGKERLAGITKQGDRYLRQLLVVGALAVMRYAQRNGTRRPWLVQLLARRTTKVATVALANKTARMVWAIMSSGEAYSEPVLQAA